MSEESITPIASRAEFLDAVRGAFALAGDTGAREIFLVDPTFADWPLNERAVIDSLWRWVDSSRSLTVLAHSFDEFARRQLRFVEWRRQWTHVGALPQRSGARGRADPDAPARPGRALRPRPRPRHESAAPRRIDRSI